MDGAFVKELAERFAAPEEATVDTGRLLVTPHGWNVHDPAALIKPGPTADKLAVYTLGAVVDYLKANKDTLDLSKLMVHVVSPQIVRLSGPLLERARNRETYVEATAQNLTDTFLGKFMSQEEFIIGLQTRFDNALDRQAVLALASTMTAEAVNTSADDGIGQTVTARAGVALKSTVSVPNPVRLTPFRTFREVMQPESLFVLRVNQSMQLGLFEADGGAWRLKAIEDVATWLRLKVPEGVSVLA